jgi:hypothetical protein
MGDDDLDLLHTGHCRGMTTNVATGLSRATARLTVWQLIGIGAGEPGEKRCSAITICRKAGCAARAECR